jgi:cytoskeletal protein CcmA (bactofilin family)
MKIKVFTAALIACTLAAFATVGAVAAQTFRADESTSIPASETIDGSAYLAGSTINVSGNVNGDLYCVGQNITITGNITGDVLCAGQTVTVNGTVEGNVRLAGQTIMIGSDVGKSATLAGQTIILNQDGQIGQDATVMGQTVTLDGIIGRDVVTSSASTTINSSIGRNVSASVDTLTLASNAEIGGKIDYTSPQKLSSAEGASVAGRVTYTEMQKDTKDEPIGYNLVGAIVWSLMLLASAVIFALLFPRLLHSTTQTSVNAVPQALLAVLVGFVAGIIMPFAIVTLMVTVLGVPVAIVVLLAWILILALSGVFAAYFAGRLIWRQQTNAVLTMLVGAFVILILLLVPIINILVGLLCLWYGTGVILIQLQKHFIIPQYDTSKYTAKAKK